jgi:hypothetical protein
MNSTRKLRSLFIVCAVAVAAVAALATQGCNGFGTTCSTTADCQAKNPGATCDPTLKVCFLYPGPYVQSIDPANQQLNVAAANGRVVVTFSEVVADASVKDPTFTVYGQGFKTPGNYLLTVDAADASVATFKPYADGLALGTDYTVTLTSAIKDLSGNTLLPFTSAFTTRDGAFIAGNSIRYATQTGQFATASNYYGEVVTAISYLLSYNSVDPSRSDFGMNAGVSAAGGSPTTATNPLQNTTGIQVNYPTVGIAADGTAFAAWNNSPTSGAITYDAEVAFWDPTVQAWRYIQQLAGPDAKAQFPQVVGFNNGNGLAVWLQALAGKQVVFGSFFLPDAGWLGAGAIQTDQTLGANPSGQARQLTLAGDIPGDSLVAWQSEQATADAGPPRILAAYLPAGGLGPPVFLSEQAGSSQLPQAALGIYGYGAVVWETQTGSTVHVFGSTLDATRPTPFSGAVQLDTSLSAFNPQVGVAANGNAVAVWQEDSQAGTNAVVSSIFTRGADGGWSAPVTLDSDATAFVFAPVIAVDPGGNAIAAWLRGTDAGYVVRAGRYTVDAGWHDVTQVGASADPVFRYPVEVVVDGLGRGFVLDTRNPGNSLYVEYIPFQ